MEEVSVTMEIKDVVEGWKKGELSGDAAMHVIHDLIYPSVITEEDIAWAKGLEEKCQDIT